jgi:hypothetical protein
MASIIHGLLIAFYGLIAAVLTAIGVAVVNYHPVDQTSQIILASFVPILTGLIAAGVHFFQNLAGTTPVTPAPTTTTTKS